MNKINVVDFGAAPDTELDSTPGILAAANQANNSGGGVVYIPAGTYMVNNIRLEAGANGLDSSLSNVEIMGDSSASEKATILKRIKIGGTEDNRIATMIGASSVRIRNLAIDQNGVKRFAGWNMFSCTNVIVEDNWAFDSDPFSYTPAPDRYSFVVGTGATPSEDITFLGNRIDNLQLEVDNVRRAQIIDNQVNNSGFTAAIGMFAVNRDGLVFEDIDVIGNTIVNPRQGIVTNLDPGDINDTTFRNITITGNTFVYTPSIRPPHKPGLVIRIGTANNSLATTGNVFENYRIEDNCIYVAPGTPEFGFARDFGLMTGISSRAANFSFTNFTIANNALFWNDPTRDFFNFNRGVGNTVEQWSNHHFRYEVPRL